MMTYSPMTIAEMVERFDFVDAVLKIPETMPEKIADNGGYIGKHGDNVSVYDAMLAEIYAERNKAKARRVRKPDNRTRAERLADWNAEKERRKDRRIDAKCNHINKKYGYLCIEQERRISAEKLARADWNTELSALTEEIECAEFMLDSDLDDLAWLKNEIFEIGNPDSVIALYEERIKELRKESERKAKLEQYKVDTEKRIRNGEEYMRKYNYVKEMI